MGTTKEEITHSESPRWGRYPETVKRSDRPVPCDRCGSAETQCVHAKGGGSIIGSYFEEEYYCPRCGCYTQYIFEYDS